VLDGAEAASGIYRVLQHKRYRRLPAALTAFNYERQDAPVMFGVPAAHMIMPREAMPWPAIVTIEEHDDGIELISEISGASDLAPVASQLARRVEQVLSAPARPLRELREG
ncbi:MAG: hypothetical protein ACRDN0_26790, partial [Trebonia sp.]